MSRGMTQTTILGDGHVFRLITVGKNDMKCLFVLESYICFIRVSPLAENV